MSPISLLMYLLDRLQDLFYFGFTSRGSLCRSSLGSNAGGTVYRRSSLLRVSAGEGSKSKWRIPAFFISCKAGMLSEKVIMEGAHHSISMSIFLGLILLNLGMAMNNIPSLTLA